MLDFTKFRMFVRIMTLLTTLRLSYPFAMIRPSWHSTTQVSMAAMVKPQVGSIVTVDCETTPDGDFVPEPLLDTHGRLTFVLGGGNYLPGLHDIVLNSRRYDRECRFRRRMGITESQSSRHNPKEGYGRSD
jgi:hypothetical protein